MKELSSYVFSPLREGDVGVHRGSGNGLSPILLVSMDENSPGSVERLEHEFALKSELDAGWAARPVALTHHNGRMTLVLEDPGGAPLDRLLGRPYAGNPLGGASWMGRRAWSSSSRDCLRCSEIFNARPPRSTWRGFI